MNDPFEFFPPLYPALPSDLAIPPHSVHWQDRVLGRRSIPRPRVALVSSKRSFSSPPFSRRLIGRGHRIATDHENYLKRSEKPKHVKLKLGFLSHNSVPPQVNRPCPAGRAQRSCNFEDEGVAEDESC